MFSEQYRRDNEKLHAKETLLMGIHQKIQEDERQTVRRARFVRYGAVAAVAVLAVAGTLAFVLTRGGGGKTALDSSSASAASILDAADATAAPETAVLEAIAEAVTEEAPVSAPKTELEAQDVTVAESYDALYARMDALLTESRKAAMFATGGSGAIDTIVASADGAVAENAAAEPTAAADMGGAGCVDFSETNVQVAGVDEADIVKTDGAYIYYVANEQLTILAADGEKTKAVSTTLLSDNDAWWGYTSEMFVRGDTLLLITQGMQVVKVAGENGGYDDNRDETQVRVYDISNREKPVLRNALAQSGNYVSSRMAGDTIYLVTTHFVWRPLRAQPVTFVPEIEADGVSKTVAAEDIYINGNPTNMAYTVIGAIDIQNTRDYAGVKAVFGGAGELYCNGKNLLLASSEYEEEVSEIAPDETGRNVQVTTSRSSTKLLLFSLDGGKIALTANGVVPGTLINQFAMDEYKGVFRVVTSVNNWTQRIYTDGVDTYEYEDSNSNGLYTFDENLQLLGKIDELAKDEWVESVRFDGDIAYFVTFRQVDPLFTVDLRDPKAPKLLSTLKIPGFSEYLHVYGEGKLLGIGYAADENTGATQGVKLSMFDTSDKKDVTEQGSARVDANWTVVGGNHKAILADPEKNLIAFPADSAYYIYAYTEQGGFTQLAKVSVTEDLYSWNLRGLFIGEYFYVLSDTTLTVISMADWKPAATLRF